MSGSSQETAGGVHVYSSTGAADAACAASPAAACLAVCSRVSWCCVIDGSTSHKPPPRSINSEYTAPLHEVAIPQGGAGDLLAEGDVCWLQQSVKR